jgi:hypothetical protein
MRSSPLNRPVSGDSTGSPIAEITRTTKAKASITLAFTEKDYSISRRIINRLRRNAAMISTVRQVKIVDYSEEIAFDYRQFLDWLRGKGLILTVIIPRMR